MIHVFDKYKAENYVPKVSTIAIRCLNSAIWPIKYSSLKSGYISSLALVFDDVNPLEGDIEDCVAFDKTKANSIVRFVERNKSKFEDIMVHCTAGASRSCAVAAALGDFYGFEYNQEIWQRSERGPNMFVYNILTNVLKEITTRIH